MKYLQLKIFVTFLNFFFFLTFPHKRVMEIRTSNFRFIIDSLNRLSYLLENNLGNIYFWVKQINYIVSRRKFKTRIK
jgi:hypothetical protein